MSKGMVMTTTDERPARKYDWVSKHDERSMNYSIPTRTIGRGYRTWEPGPTLDQGEYGYCVGFGITGELLAKPIQTGQPTFDFAASIFHLALRLDDIAGEADDTGTSVLAGAKACQKMGFISEYRWCFGVDEVARGIYNHGPVVVGTPWLDTMETPQYLEGWDSVSGNPRVPNGPVLDISGSEIGGHCYVATGFTRFGNTEWFKILNSWGYSWGDQGSAWIRKDDMAKMLRTTGEACILFDVSVAPGTPATLKRRDSGLLESTPGGMRLPEGGAFLPSRSGM
jgi:hypothetical protein